MFSLTEVMSGGRCGQTTDLHLLSSHPWVPFNSHRASEASRGRGVWGVCKIEPGQVSKGRDLTARGEVAQTSLVQTQEATVPSVQGCGR